MLTDEAVETIRTNLNEFTAQAKENPSSNRWIYNLLPQKPFKVKKYLIDDFELNISSDGNYKTVDFDNSIKLYEHLSCLPKHILTDERFWLWLYIDKFYPQTIQAMPITSNSTIKDHWLFSQGNRRGVFFGVLSRCFFRVYLTAINDSEDKYEYSKFVIDNPERFRNLSWRSYSSQKHIVLGAIKAEKAAEEKYGELIKPKYYKEIAKYLARYGSVRLLDAVPEEEIYSIVLDKLAEMSKERSAL